MARDSSSPFKSCVFERVSRRYEVAAEARAARQHKRAITTAAIHDIMYHNHNKNIPCGL